MAKEAGSFGQKPASFWPEAGFCLKEAGLRRLSRLLQVKSRLTPANAGFTASETCKSRLTPANAGLHEKTRKSRLTPAYAGFLPWRPKDGRSRPKPAEAGSFSGQKEPAFGQKEPAFGQKEPASFPLGATERSRLMPAKAGSFRPERSRLFMAKAGSFSGRLWPASAGLLPWRPTETVRHCGEPPLAALLVPERCHIWHLFDAGRGFCGKHSYRAQREDGSRRKPAFTVFSWVQEAGESRLCQSRLVSARRGSYYLRWEPNPTEEPRRGSEGVFLTRKEGS